MQSEHHQQMADLLAKQRLKQEAFLQQQEELMLEIRKVYSTAFCASDSQKLLAWQTTSHDYLANHENGSLNSSINPFPSGLCSKKIYHLKMQALQTYCILMDTDLEGYLTSTSASTEKGHTVTYIKTQS